MVCFVLQKMQDAFMPNEKQPSTDGKNLSVLEKLPDLVWEEITKYLDLKSKHQVRLSSKTNKNHIDNHYFSIHFKNQAQYCKFIENPSFYPPIKNLHLSADATNFIFPYTGHSYASQFSFFSEVKRHFPSIKNIYLELRHLYILLMLTSDPKFDTNYTLIKKLTLIPLQVSLLERKGLKKIKLEYDDDAKIRTIEIENYYNNRYLTRETLNVFKKFTSLQHLSLSLYDGVSCDYEDLAHLLQALPLLKTLELDLPFELAYEPEGKIIDEEFKDYQVEEDALKSYPNIRTLTLTGRYWSASLLTHFPRLSQLTLDFRHYDSLEPASDDAPNKIIQLLAQLPYPKKLLSLEIPASVPYKLDADYNFKLTASNLAALTPLTRLQKLRINPPKNFYYIEYPRKKFYQIKENPALFIRKNYSLASVKELEICYNPYNSYHRGDFVAIRSVFPNLTRLKITLEKQTWSSTNPFNELYKVLKENPWKNIQISIHGIDFSPDLNLLFPNAEFAENRFTLRINTYKREEAAEISRKQEFRI